MTREFLRKKVEIIVFILMILGIMSPLRARVQFVVSASSFERAIGKTPYAVVLFYNHDRAMRKADSDLYVHNTQLEAIFKGASDRSIYQQAEIQFLMINVAKSRLTTIAADYGFNKFPVCVLFKNGMPMVTPQRQRAVIEGFFHAEQLHSLINSCWGKDIEMALKDKREERREIARERAYYAPSLSFGWGYPSYYGGWGYPYGGYGYWGRPYRRFGFGIGF
jgi:hypothetical protein